MDRAKLAEKFPKMVVRNRTTHIQNLEYLSERIGVTSIHFGPGATRSVPSKDLLQIPDVRIFELKSPTILELHEAGVIQILTPDEIKAEAEETERQVREHAAAAEGASGATGETGASGSTGVVGETGVSGASGTTGASGVSGATGITSPSVAGSTGTSSTSGTTGATDGTSQSSTQSVPSSATTPSNKSVSGTAPASAS